MNLELQQYLLITLRKIELILIGGSGKEQTKVDFISFMISYLLYNMFVSFQKEIFEETYYMILDIFPFLLCWLRPKLVKLKEVIKIFREIFQPLVLTTQHPYNKRICLNMQGVDIVNRRGYRGGVQRVPCTLKILNI